MLISLKENEIGVAVKRYLADQGISLSGKSVAIEFIATRSNGGGIRADISIDELESDIPGFDRADDAQPLAEDKPTLAVVQPVTNATAAVLHGNNEVATAVATPAKSVKEIAAAAAAVVLDEDKAAATEAAPAKPTTSLFGS